MKKNIYITKPLLPDLNALYVEIEDIWKTAHVTNMGHKHNLLEERLKETLKVENLSLFNNGTIALLVALKALGLPVGSEVITTPFTFAATPHCLAWNGLLPVFCDIEQKTMCINPDLIENYITEKTSAILAVHVYGFPCDVEKIQAIAQKHRLKVIYDAAHAFSTEINQIGIGNFGDVSVFSFHATKLFNTIEGGCITFSDENLLKKINCYRNFGIEDEDNVRDIGINGKMNELQAAVGLLNLNIYKDEQKKRAKIKAFYDKSLSGIKGIRIPNMNNKTSNSYQYYPILLEKNYSISRDLLHEKLKQLGFITRKYFYPLCSDYDCYKNLKSSSIENLPIANDFKRRILCLPFYGDINHAHLIEICEAIASYA